MLDPTRDQYGEDPFSETHQREYIRDASDPPVDLDGHIYGMLNMQLPWKESAVRALVEQYDLDISQLEVASA
ncbi:MAG TPA: hypothetical protein VGX26_02680 [Solirubrobacteraceae bacterium]|nr:hypothetical protein [Solirubrobacteraceae bacterium]